MADSRSPEPFGPPPTTPPVKARATTSVDPFAFAGEPATQPARQQGSREGLWVALAALLGAAVAIALIVWLTS